MFRCSRTVFILAAALLALIACSKSEPAATDKRLTIAMIPKGTTHEFWKAVHAGAAQAATELNIELIWKGALREDSREEQIKIVEDFVNRGVAGIVLSPLDDTALRLPVRNAMQSGVPVVIFDSGLKSDDFVSFVATDNYQGGVVAAEELAKLVGGKGRVVMMRYLEGSDSTSSREQAFLDTMKRYPDIEIVSANQFSGATVEGAYRTAENILLPLKKEDGSLSIDGIFCACEPTVFGMLRALEDQGLAGKVHFVGFDSTKKLAQALDEGKISALVMQDPVRIGHDSVVTMVKHVKGERVEKRVDTGITVATRSNMKDERIHALLYPDIKRWLGEG